jgi:hypothetical protein
MDDGAPGQLLFAARILREPVNRVRKQQQVGKLFSLCIVFPAASTTLRRLALRDRFESSIGTSQVAVYRVVRLPGVRGRTWAVLVYCGRALER